MAYDALCTRCGTELDYPADDELVAPAGLRALTARLTAHEPEREASLAAIGKTIACSGPNSSRLQIAEPASWSTGHPPGLGERVQQDELRPDAHRQRHQEREHRAPGASSSPLITVSPRDATLRAR